MLPKSGKDEIERALEAASALFIVRRDVPCPFSRREKVAGGRMREMRRQPATYRISTISSSKVTSSPARG